jgi:hypothetical protein
MPSEDFDDLIRNLEEKLARVCEDHLRKLATDYTVSQEMHPDEVEGLLAEARRVFESAAAKVVARIRADYAPRA